MITEINEVAYAVYVFGQPYGPKYPTSQLAEAAILNLPAAQQTIAEIVPIQRDSGKQLLCG